MVRNQDRELKEVKALSEQRQVHILELKKELHEQQSKLDELKEGNEPDTSSNQDRISLTSPQAAGSAPWTCPGFMQGMPKFSAF